MEVRLWFGFWINLRCVFGGGGGVGGEGGGGVREDGV